MEEDNIGAKQVNMRKRLSRHTTTDDKDQADLKSVTQDDISTKKKGSNVRMINSKKRFYDENERRIWGIGRRQWFGWKEWMCSKWRDKVDIVGEMEDEGEITSTGNFGTYRRMCGFGGGACRSVI